MKDNKLNEILQQAEKTGSYLITATIRDKDKKENDLTHHVSRLDFPTDDIVPSLDNSVRLLDINKKQPTPVVKLEPVSEDLPPLKIAIMTHFNRCPDHYSPGRAVKNQIKMLQHYGHEVVFFLQEGSKLDAGCKMMPVVPRFKREKNVVNNEAKEKFIKLLKDEVDGKFDVVITHDFYIDDCITYREGIKESGIRANWIHWARSGIGRPINFAMENARYMYMNYADAGIFAERIGVKPEQVRVVFNEKDPALMWNWHPATKLVSDHMKLWNKDIIQTYPICTTRMDAKGINSVIKIFGEMKRHGKKVALIIANSNGRRRVQEIESKIKFAEENGLTKEDFVFTSTLSTKEIDIVREVPNQTVVELLQVSNLLIFPTIAEVCSNILLEASMTKNLLVLNSDLPSLFDFADHDDVLEHPFSSLQNINYSGKTNEDLRHIARSIIRVLDKNKPDQQFRRVWKTHSFDGIYNKMLKPILYE